MKNWLVVEGLDVKETEVNEMTFQIVRRLPSFLFILWFLLSMLLMFYGSHLVWLVTAEGVFVQQDWGRVPVCLCLLRRYTDLLVDV